MPHPFTHETTHSRLSAHAGLGLGVAAAVAALALAHAAPAQAASQQRFRSGIYSDMCLTDAGVTKPILEVCVKRSDRYYASQHWIASGYDRKGYFVRLRNAATKRCLDSSPSGLRLLTSCWPAGSRYATFQSWHESHTGRAPNEIHLHARYKSACLSAGAMGTVPLRMTGCAVAGSRAGGFQVWRVE